MSLTCILAAREHLLMRSLKRALEDEFEVVAMVDNIISLEESIRSLSPHFVVVDLDLLGGDAARTLELIRRRASRPAVIGLLSDDEASTEGLDLDGVVSRQSAGRELPAAARQLLARNNKKGNGGHR